MWNWWPGTYSICFTRWYANRLPGEIQSQNIDPKKTDTVSWTSSWCLVIVESIQVFFGSKNSVHVEAPNLHMKPQAHSLAQEFLRVEYQKCRWGRSLMGRGVSFRNLQSFKPHSLITIVPSAWYEFTHCYLLSYIYIYIGARKWKKTNDVGFTICHKHNYHLGMVLTRTDKNGDDFGMVPFCTMPGQAMPPSPKMGAFGTNFSIWTAVMSTLV